MALLTFVDADRVWLKARSGIDLTELDRGDAFCAHTIMADDVLVIPDTLGDARFADNPFVCGPPNVRFYAGAPLTVAPGSAIGTLCILDVAPRAPLSDHERRVLADLASMVVDRLEKRRLVAAEQDATARFLKIAATSPDAVICSNGEGRIIFWNNAATRIFGHHAEQIVGEPQTVLLPEDARPGFVRWMAKARQYAPDGRIEGNAEFVCLPMPAERFTALMRGSMRAVA